jgi:DNA-binding NtrC family response regulator
MRAKSKRVLIVDPHEEVLISLQKSLEDAGFDTETAWTGADAIRLLRKREFDIVLINEYLPDCDCGAMLRQMQEQCSNLTYVVMQSYAPRMDQNDRFKDLGTSAVVCKYDVPEVVAAVIREGKPGLTLWPQEKLHAAG